MAAFVQQVAVSHLAHGYFFYVAGELPDGKDAGALDSKLIERYGIDRSKWSRARRKRAGIASVAYLRYERLFVLLATHGEHRFFADEQAVIRDFRRRPLLVGGYSISHRGGHPHVRIAEREFRELKAYFLELATRRQASTLAEELRSLPWEPYAPVRRQFSELLRLVNKRRAIASLEPVSASCLRLKRQSVQVFLPDLLATSRVARSAASPPGGSSDGTSLTSPLLGVQGGTPCSSLLAFSAFRNSQEGEACTGLVEVQESTYRIRV